MQGAVTPVSGGWAGRRVSTPCSLWRQQAGMQCACPGSHHHTEFSFHTSFLLFSCQTEKDSATQVSTKYRRSTQLMFVMVSHPAIKSCRVPTMCWRLFSEQRYCSKRSRCSPCRVELTVSHGERMTTCPPNSTGHLTGFNSSAKCTATFPY